MRNKLFRPTALIRASRELDNISRQISEILSHQSKKSRKRGWLHRLFGWGTEK
jgi:hypothetical protein